MPSEKSTAGTSRRTIAREHLYGATIRAFGAGAATVRPWTRTDQFSKFAGSA